MKFFSNEFVPNEFLMVFMGEIGCFSAFLTIFGCSVGSFKGRRSKNGQKWAKFFSNKFVPNEFLMVLMGEIGCFSAF